MKPILRDICHHLGLEHVANLPKKGFGMLAVLNQSKDWLVGGWTSFKNLDTNPFVNETISGLGKSLAPFAGANMNTL